MKKKRSYLAWYLASPFFVFGLFRLALGLTRFMDTKREFKPVYDISNAAPEQYLASPDAAKAAASSALRDLAHDATSAGNVEVAKRAYDVESALARGRGGDPRGVRDAMQRLEREAGDADRIAAQLAFARVRVGAWLALVVTD